MIGTRSTDVSGSGGGGSTRTGGTLGSGGDEAGTGHTSTSTGITSRQKLITIGTSGDDTGSGMLSTLGNGKGFRGGDDGTRVSSGDGNPFRSGSGKRSLRGST